MYSATVENRGSAQFFATTKNSGFIMGPDNVGPIDALLASLCACVGYHIRERLAALKVTAAAFSLKADGTKSSDGLTLAHIAMVLHVDGRKLSDVEKAALLAEAKACPIHNTLAKALTIDFSIV